jgi:hypothetical protein
MGVIIRNVIGLVFALIPWALAADERGVVSFEIAMARPFGGQAVNAPAHAKESNSVTPPEQNRSEDAVKPAVRSAAQGLKLYVLVGEQAVNSISNQSATAPIVEVRDERNLPIAGAEVVFQLPSSGPGGYFPNQQLTWTGTTDANGQVVTAGLTPNREAGPFLIRVRATYGGRSADTVVHQRNAQRAVSLEDSTTTRKRSGKWWKIAAVAGAGGAVGGIVWATQRGSGNPTVLLQPGTISFGGPR